MVEAKADTTLAAKFVGRCVSFAPGLLSCPSVAVACHAGAMLELLLLLLLLQVIVSFVVLAFREEPVAAASKKRQ